MSRRDESEFPFAYLSEKKERAMPGNTPVSSARRNPASGARTMTQQIQILMLIALGTVLIFLILLYFTIMTITVDAGKADIQTSQTTTQSEVSLLETTAVT
jgi:hypothetical protein